MLYSVPFLLLFVCCNLKYIVAAAKLYLSKVLALTVITKFPKTLEIKRTDWKYKLKSDKERQPYVLKTKPVKLRGYLFRASGID
jgi:hypothetical protein